MQLKLSAIQRRLAYQFYAEVYVGFQSNLKAKMRQLGSLGTART